MGVLVNHAIAMLLEPLLLSMIGMVVGSVFLAVRRRRIGWTVLACSFAWLYVCSTPLVLRFVGYPLEQLYPPTDIDGLPRADGIVLLSGGMGGSPRVWKYGEMWAGADRTWHAGRLWKAGKAPIVLTTGMEEDDSTVNLLKDMGVDGEAIVQERASLNTEQNAKFTAETLRRRFPGKREFRILLVTSAWHMRRSELMFRKYAPGIEVVPVAADYEHSVLACNLKWYDYLLPRAGSLSYSAMDFKEVVGYWGYKLRGW